MHLSEIQFKEHIDYFQENYLELVAYVSPTQKIFIGEKSESRVCRFCGCDDKSKFQTEAHAISECIGNKWIILLDECDTCNAKFSKAYENDLSNYLNYILLSTGVTNDGASKKLKFKTTSEREANYKFSREGGQNLFKVQVPDVSAEHYVNLNQQNKTFELTFPNTSYTPINIYKAFVKMALSIMPTEKMQYFKSTIAFLNDTQNSRSCNEAMMFLGLSPGINSYKDMEYFAIYEKCSDSSDPSYVVYFAIGSTSYQFIIPACSLDKPGTTGILKLFPSLHDISHPIGPDVKPDYHIINLQSIDREKKQHKMTFSFEELKQDI